MKIIFDCEETEEQVVKAYHTLMGALMLRIGSSVGVKPARQKEVRVTLVKWRKRRVMLQRIKFNKSHKSEAN